MSDRLYLYAVPAPDAPKIAELYETPFSLPFESYTEGTVLYTHGPPRHNPRYDELADFAFSLPYVYLAKWPSGHLNRLHLKWSSPTKDDYIGWMDYSRRGITPPLPPDKASTLLQRQLPRAQNAQELTLDQVAAIFDFLREHQSDHFFLDIS